MFFIVCIILVFFPEKAALGATEGLKMAMETVIPSILPFAVFSSAVVYSGGAEKISRVAMPLFKVLKLNPYGSVAFLSGLFGGYPTGAKTVCEMYEKQLIKKDEAEEILAYVNNGGVVFALNICGLKAFGQSGVGWIIFVSQAVGALLAGKIISREYKCENFSIVQNERQSLMAVFGRSIVSGGTVAVNILSAFIVFYALMGACGVEKTPVLSGFCEMTKGIFYAGENNLPALGALFFSFGGISVFCQSAALCEKYSLRLHKCILGKILTAAFAFMIAFSIEKVMAGQKDVALLAALSITAIWCAVKIIKKVGVA